MASLSTKVTRAAPFRSSKATRPRVAAHRQHLRRLRLTLLRLEGLPWSLDDIATRVRLRDSLLHFLLFAVLANRCLIVSLRVEPL